MQTRNWIRWDDYFLIKIKSSSVMIADNHCKKFN